MQQPALDDPAVLEQQVQSIPFKRAGSARVTAEGFAERESWYLGSICLVGYRG